VIVLERISLCFGLVADIVTDETDRPAMTPPLIPHGEHHDRCGCEACVRLRALKAKSA